MPSRKRRIQQAGWLRGQSNPPVKGLCHPGTTLFGLSFSCISSHIRSRWINLRPFNSISSSCIWISGSKPSDIFIRCAVNVAMFRSLNSTRLDRGADGSGRLRGRKRQPLKSSGEVIDTSLFLRPTHGRLGRMGTGEPPRVFGTGCSGARPALPPSDA